MPPPTAALRALVPTPFARPRRESSAGFTLELLAHDRWRLSGDVDSMSAGILVGAAEASGTREPVLYLDCSGVRFIDVAGWRSLAAIRQVFHPITDLRICHPSPAVSRLIQLVGHP